MHAIASTTAYPTRPRTSTISGRDAPTAIAAGVAARTASPTAASGAPPVLSARKNSARAAKPPAPAARANQVSARRTGPVECSSRHQVWTSSAVTATNAIVTRLLGSLASVSATTPGPTRPTPSTTSVEVRHRGRGYAQTAAGASTSAPRTSSIAAGPSASANLHRHTATRPTTPTVSISPPAHHELRTLSITIPETTHDRHKRTPATAIRGTGAEWSSGPGCPNRRPSRNGPGRAPWRGRLPPRGWRPAASRTRR